MFLEFCFWSFHTAEHLAVVGDCCFLLLLYVLRMEKYVHNIFQKMRKGKTTWETWEKMEVIFTCTVLRQDVLEWSGLMQTSGGLWRTL